MTTTSEAPPTPAPPPFDERPSADPGRGRVRMTVAHLAVLAQRAAGTRCSRSSPVAEADLVAAGVLGADGTVPAELADLVATFAGPSLVAEVETGTAGEVVRHSVALRGSRGWSAEGWPGSALSEYVPFEATLLVPTLARLAGLRSLPAGLDPVADGSRSPCRWRSPTGRSPSRSRRSPNRPRRLPPAPPRWPAR